MPSTEIRENDKTSLVVAVVDSPLMMDSKKRSHDDDICPIADCRMAPKRPLDDASHHAFRQHMREPSAQMLADRGYLAYLHDDILGRVCLFLDPDDLAPEHSFVGPLMMPAPLCLRECIEFACDRNYIFHLIQRHVHFGGTDFVRGVISYIPARRPSDDDFCVPLWSMDLRKIKYCLSDPEFFRKRRLFPVLGFGNCYAMALAMALCVRGESSDEFVSECICRGFVFGGGHTGLEFLILFDALPSESIEAAIDALIRWSFPPTQLIAYITRRGYVIQLREHTIDLIAEMQFSKNRKVWLRAIAESSHLILSPPAYHGCLRILARGMHCEELRLFLGCRQLPLYWTGCDFDIVATVANNCNFLNTNHRELIGLLIADSRVPRHKLVSALLPYDLQSLARYPELTSLRDLLRIRRK